MAKKLKPHLLMMVSAGAIGMITSATAQTPKPWDTPQGRACFERWIAESMAKLNAYNGSPDFNSRKPWSINKYGLLQGTPSPFSAYAPDDFPQFNNSKYWWMWDKWVPTGSNGYWLWPEWNGAKVESIRPYVSRCLG